MFEFRCPYCSAPLRVRERSYVGRTIACPDCREALEIVATEEGQLEGRATGQTATLRQTTSAVRPSVIAMNAATRVPGLATIQTSPWPRRVAFTVAGVLLGGLAVLSMWSEPQNPKQTDQPPPLIEQVPPVAPVPLETPKDLVPVDSSLTRLGVWLLADQQQTGAFPSGVVESNLPVADRLSWQAALVAKHGDGSVPGPDAARAWNDLANDRFIRRRVPELMNPNIANVVSEDRYPAGHFVGVTGVGADSELLPKQHPRAGIFGVDRRTAIADIKDGTANTMLVAGVESSLASWANGSHSIRGFTKEPYINGPDGFGTGQGAGMHVLMADGSVRFLSKDTDPRIIRRMAAMVDGYPLDPQVPGEPGDQSAAPVLPIALAPPLPGGNAEDAAPIAVEITPDSPSVDIDRALAQPIARFVQPTPTSVGELLRLIEEMAAIPIDRTQVVSFLDLQVTLELEHTTVGAILTAVLKQASLREERRPSGLVILPE